MALRTVAQTRLTIAAVLLLSLSPATPFLDAPRSATGQSPCFVSIADGEILGANLGPTCAFLGVPFGASTAGSNRWRPPQPPQPWSTVLDAAGTPVGCPSVSFFGTTPSFGGNEDCLRLNVWVRNPLPETPAPVLVWLHTGAFTGGSGFFIGHRGPAFAAETGVIVVAPNYRVGPFGFLAHPALDDEDPDGTSGNYGLLDQQAALRWVRDNIARFGGDPHNVTIAGTSAGGQSVGLQLVSPRSAGLFHRAIVQSAYPTSRWRTREEARAQGEAFAAGLECPDLPCMRLAPQNDVLTALAQAAQQVLEPPGRTFWEPSIDGVVLPDQPRVLFEAGASQRVPTITGFNRDEGWGPFISRSFPAVNAATYEGWVASEFGPFAPGVLTLYADAAATSPIEAMARVVGDVQFACEARRLARLIERTGTPTYVYSYEHEIDALSPDHVIHGVESNVLFRNNYTIPPFAANYTLAAEELSLHAAMAGYWARFAATGNPNRGDDTVFSWAPFKRPDGPGRGGDRYIMLKPELDEGTRLRESACNFFEPFFFRSVLGGLPAVTP
jgi:para-nitrobenzyl esterase